MISYLLQTKTRIPPLRTQHAPRQRLLHKVNAHADARLVLVSAPAGFGKSSCLVEWAHTQQLAGTRVAWYALDEQDNDPVRFAAYLVNVMQALDADFAALFHANQQVDLLDAETIILNAVAQRAEPFCLVLDDYHLITSRLIHDAVNRMCEYLPPNMRLVIGTRADPPLQLARLRARGEIVEIRMLDLCFTREEMAQLLHATLHWMPSAGLLQQLDEVTEGWAAALSLIIMRLRQHPPAEYEDEVALQLARYSQTQRHLFDYLAEEVFAQQPEATRRFLLDTCMLNRLHPQLCSALSRDPAAPLLLNQLATESLFVMPLSAVEPVYRYHHLLETFLRDYLQLHDPQRLLDQHRAAAEWYAAHHAIGDAVYHALAAQAYAYAATLIEESAWATLTSRGEIATILSWLPRFPVDVLRQFPRLCLYFSRALYLTGDVKQSQAWVQVAMQALDEQTQASAERDALRAVVANYQASLAAYRGEINVGLALNARARAQFDHVKPLDQVRIANTEAQLHYLRGDVDVASSLYVEALTLARRHDHQYLMLDAEYYLAQLELMGGALTRAQKRCEAVIARYATRIAPMSAILLPLARVHYEQNRIVEAETLLCDAIKLAQRGRAPDILWSAHLQLAAVLATRAEYGEAQAQIQHARAVARGFDSPIMRAMIAATEVRILLRAEPAHAAVAAYGAQQRALTVEYQHDYESLTQARVSMALGCHAAALALLQGVLDGAQAGGRTGHVIEAMLLQALVYHMWDKPVAALTALQPALALAAARGYCRLVLDSGKPMLALLQRAAQRGIETAYVGALLATAQQQATPQEGALPAGALTARELEVLELIASGASNQQIADTLVVSLGTTKSHINHIMNKLDARNRTEAVAKARSLYLLNSV